MIKSDVSLFIVRVNGALIAKTALYADAQGFLDACAKMFSPTRGEPTLASIIGPGKLEFYRLEPLSADTGNIVCEWRSI